MDIDFSSPLKSIPFLKEVPARILRTVGREAKWFSLKAGSPLFLQGETAQDIHFVLSGSLGTFRPYGRKGKFEFVGHIRPGEPVGEMALFSGRPEHVNAPHSNSVYALRDSEILSISRKGFDRLVKSRPDILQRLIRLILLRLRQAGRRSARAEPKVFTFVATSPTMNITYRAHQLKEALARMGLSAIVVNKDTGGNKPVAFFDELERTYNIIILTTRLSADNWYKLAVRQADRIWVFGRANAVPSDPIMLQSDSPAYQFKLVDVIILHYEREKLVTPPHKWRSAASATRIFHWSMHSQADCQRMARIISGRSVGLVLSGGGARAYAHIGVVKAMREMNVPIDFVGGTSMGAMIAACVAMGWSDDEIDWRIRKSFVKSNPLGDYVLPVVSMVRGHRVQKRLKEHFGDAMIGNLKVPFFCVSSNLTDSEVFIHRSGYVRDALRASISLPGILPPVIEDEDVLVDGAVLNNFPVDIMQGMHRGFIIGSDVSRESRGFPADEFLNPPGFFRWVLQHGFHRTPPIVSLLMRAATVKLETFSKRELTHICITPNMDAIQLRDWDVYDEAVERGYEAAIRAIKASPFSMQLKSDPVPLPNMDRSEAF